jgi:hypothetical protein
MSRYDKYDPKNGGFRAPLAADFDPEDVEYLIGVGLDEDGRVVKGEGNTGIKGVLVLTMARKAGEVIDVMTSGEIVEFEGEGGKPGIDLAKPGTNYFVDGDGSVKEGGGDCYVGHTVQSHRLVVRFAVAGEGGED